MIVGINAKIIRLNFFDILTFTPQKPNKLRRIFLLLCLNYQNTISITHSSRVAVLCLKSTKYL